jgi:dihydroorotate dehydrogenase electron transfer subunit
MITVPRSRSRGSLPLVGRVGEGVVEGLDKPMPGAFELVLRHQWAVDQTQPGQFFQFAVGAPHALLRRPYSAAWTDPPSGRIGFIFNVVGAGSDWLSRRRLGDTVDLLGPLGSGFNLESDRPAICIAGGLGVAVFPGVVKALVERGRPVSMLLGARTAQQLLPVSRFPSAEVSVATDDGSAGLRGSVVDLLPPLHDSELFACGPTPMLQALIKRALEVGISPASIQIALETPMGCGLGTCLACVAPSRDGGYLLTCQDGPCVHADQLDWTRMRDVFHG